jgi:flagellar assembly protein FliH
VRSAESETIADVDGAPGWMAADPSPGGARVLRDCRSAAPLDLAIAAGPGSGEGGVGGVGGAGGVGAGGPAITWAIAYRAGFDAGRADGLANGHDEGFRRGTEAARRKAHDELSAMLTSFEVALADALTRLDHAAEQVSGGTTELALAVASAILDRELVTASDPGAEAVRRALAVAPVRGPVRVLLNPLDAERLCVPCGELAPGRTVERVADPSVDPGGCRLESGATSVDAGPAAALRRVRAVLGLENRPEEPRR